jgi:hypothetical protein
MIMGQACGGVHQRGGSVADMNNFAVIQAPAGSHRIFSVIDWFVGHPCSLFRRSITKSFCSVLLRRFPFSRAFAMALCKSAAVQN